MLLQWVYSLLLLILVSRCFNSLVSKYNAITVSKSLARVTPSFTSTSSSTNDIDSSSTLTPTHLSRKVFCNVELNGELIEAVGFDMDFTLAQVLH